MYVSTVFAAIVLAAGPFVSAHGLVSSVTGDLGGKGTGFGVAAGGANNRADVTVFKTGAFGATAAGPINPVTALAAMQKVTGATLPQVKSVGGVVTMTYHQQNGDGAGPIACSVSADASGKTFTPMKITTQVPGTNGRSNANNQDFPLVASMPAGVACTGNVGASSGVCLIKCQNPAGPFGSVVPVQMVAGKKARSGGSVLAMS